LFPAVLAEKLQNLRETRRVVIQTVLAQLPHKFPLRPMLEYLGDLPFGLSVSASLKYYPQGVVRLRPSSW
jgi:hypothetical protein